MLKPDDSNEGNVEVVLIENMNHVYSHAKNFSVWAKLPIQPFDAHAKEEIQEIAHVVSTFPYMELIFDQQVCIDDGGSAVQSN